MIATPPAQTAWAAGSDKPELDTINIGFVPLTDCAPIIMAAHLGFDRKHGITLQPHKQSSWASVRDNLLRGQLHASQALYGLVYGVHTGIGGLQQDMAVLMSLSQNGQAITLSNNLRQYGVHDGHTLARCIASRSRPYTFAQTFPTGTHAMWLYYWLAAHDIDPMQDIHRVVVPPSQMVENLRMGNMDGFCAGEPWNQQAIIDRLGFTVATSQQIWPDHPEKVLATTADFAERHPNSARALIQATLEASRWLDASPENRSQAAEIISAEKYLNTNTDVIRERMLGSYEDGLGRRWQDTHAMRFFADGAASFPWLSDGMWFLTQHQRWGLLQEAPDYGGIARHINRLDLYAEAASASGISLPASPMRSSVLMDGRCWDGSQTEAFSQSHLLQP